MASLLLLETATPRALVALSVDGAVVAVRAVDGVRDHARVVLPAVMAVLAEAERTLADLDAIALGVGPGSFTGLRVACAAAQGLGYSLDKPLLPIVTLDILAEEARHEAVPGRDIVATVDARMGEIYWARYAIDDTGLTPVVPPQVTPPAAVALDGACVCGTGVSVLAEQGRSVTAVSPSMPGAAAMAALAEAAWQRGAAQAPETVAPLYVRDRVAWKSGEGPRETEAT